MRIGRLEELLVVERDRRCTGELSFDHRVTQACAADDCRSGEHPGVTAGVIDMRMSIDDVLDRFIRQFLHPGHDVVMIPVEFRIDEDGALVRQVDRRIAAFAQNDVEIICDFLHL